MHMKNLPAENFHTIEVAPFSNTKSSLEADMLLSLSDIASCCYYVLMVQIYLHRKKTANIELKDLILKRW